MYVLLHGPNEGELFSRNKENHKKYERFLISHVFAVVFSFQYGACTPMLKDSHRVSFRLFIQFFTEGPRVKLCLGEQGVKRLECKSGDS